MSEENETTPTPFSGFYGENGVNQEALDALPESHGVIKSLVEKYPTGEDALLKGIHHLRATASSKGLERLAPDATDEEKHRHTTMVKEYFGVPDQVDGYGVTKPEDIPEEVWNAEETDALLGILHQHNASPELVKALAEHRINGFKEQIAKAPELEKARVDEVNKELQESFGNDLPVISESAKKGLKVLGVELPESGNLADMKISYTDIVKAGARVTELIAEDSQARELRRDKSGNTAGTYREQANAVKTDPSNPFYADFTSEEPARQKRAQAEYLRLMNLADAMEK